MARLQDHEQPISVGIADALAIARMQQGTILMVTLLVVGVSVVFSLLKTPQYQSSVVLHLRSQAGQEWSTERLNEAEYRRPRKRKVVVQTQLEILNSRSVLSAVVKRLEETGLPGAEGAFEGPERLRSRLKVRIRSESDVLEISVRHESPEIAAATANLIASVYREFNLDASRDSARDARIWLQREGEAYQKRIDDLHNEIVSYQAMNDLADAELAITARSAEMSAISLAFGDTRKLEISLKSKIQTHRDLSGRGQYSELAKAMDTQLVNALTEDYSNAVTEHAQLSARYGERHPERQYAEAVLARIETELKQEVARTIDSEKAELLIVQANQQSLRDELESAKVGMLNQQRLLDGYKRLRRELERSTTQFEKLNQRLDELDLQAKTQLSNVRVIDEAIPATVQSSPKLFLNLMTALVLGSGLGILIGFLREFMNDSITTRVDVETFLRVPYLGQVGRISASLDRKSRALFTHNNPGSAEAESFRGIRTILDMSPDGPFRCLLITSALMAEGKTESTVRLAIAFARLGRRVLIIDGDLRRPRIHKVFSAERGPGLSEALDGAEFSHVVQKTQIEKLDIIPAGLNSIGFVERLANPEMRQILKLATQEYDLVLVDSSPAALTADAAMLSKLTDGVVFISQEATGSRRVVQQAILDLESAGARIVGAIINAIESKHGTPYSYRYTYSYGEEQEYKAKDNVAK
jgi:capsular exopolysaccharide synthesis family protein